jgi:O-antigen/teichoic acid export membrane protein
MQINLKKIFHNFNANLYLTITLFLYQLISVPIFLKFQNPEIYGIWIIIYAIPWYFLFVDLGLSYNFSIINNLITNKLKLKRSDNDILNVIFSTNILFFSFGSILFFIILITFDLSKIFNIDTGLVENINITIFVIFMFSILSIFFTFIESVYRLKGFFPKGVYLTTNFKNIENFSFLFLIIFLDIYIASICILLLRLIFIIYGIKLIKKSFNFKFLFSQKFIVDDFKSVINPTFSFFLQTLSSSISIYLPVFIISFFYNPLVLITFTIPRTITRLILQMTSILSKSFYPEYTDYYSKENLNACMKIINSSNLIIFYINLIFLFFLTYFGHIIIELWTGGNVIISKKLLLVLLLTVFTHSVAYSLYNFFHSINQHSMLSKTYLLLTILSSLLSIFLAFFKMDLYVVLSPYILSEFILFIVCSYKLSVFFGVKMRDIFVTFFKKIEVNNYIV